jgi:hypothetical protein
MDQLKKDIKATLANRVCSAQALDEAVDRYLVLKELIKMLDKGYIIFKKCIGCSGPLNQEEVRNALSRYGHGYICSDCGVREALEAGFITHGNQS